MRQAVDGMLKLGCRFKVESVYGNVPHAPVRENTEPIGGIIRSFVLDSPLIARPARLGNVLGVNRTLSETLEDSKIIFVELLNASAGVYDDIGREERDGESVGNLGSGMGKGK